jgi:CYTH domain-containing protein
MDKSSGIEYRRMYLVADMPEGLVRSDDHVQLSDEYIPRTRLRIRKVRVPGERSREWILQQRLWLSETSNMLSQTVNMQLNEAEYAQFQYFEGSEIRKNRYASVIEGREAVTDVYLGELSGLIRVSFGFEAIEAAAGFNPLGRTIFADITDNTFYRDDNLVNVLSAGLSEALADLFADT